MQEYLNFLGMPPEKYQYTEVECEVCGGTKFQTVRDIISWNNEVYGKLPVKCCERCGFLMQNPRFNREFYDDYYGKAYRDKTKGSQLPAQSYIDDQIIRGRLLFEVISRFRDMSTPGKIADIGSSVGGFLVPFKNHGWETYGCDPNKEYVLYGKEKLGLNVEYASAEDVKLPENYYDIIIIMGSLEHVYDPNKVLEVCRKACKDDGILVLEGRGEPRGLSKDYFNQSHHRYLTTTSIELFMMKHGWEPIYTTDTERVTGPSRPTNIYSIGRACDISTHAQFVEKIENGKREIVSDVIKKFDDIDKSLSAQKS